MKINLLALLIFSSFAVHAQSDPLGAFNKHVVEKWTHEYVRYGAFKVKGSPYLLGEAFAGQAMVNGTGSVTDKRILFNLPDQKVGFEMDGQFVVPDGNVTSFALVLPEKYGSQTLEFTEWANFKNHKQKGYVQLVAKNKKAIFLKNYRSRVINDPSDPYSKEIKIFEQYSEYFIYDLVSNELHAVKLRDKDILKALAAFPDARSLATELGWELNSEKNVAMLIQRL